MAENNRFRPWTVIFYGSHRELCSILREHSAKIAHWAFILHDKCIYDSDLMNNDGVLVHKKGELEKPHFHLLLDFYNGHSFTAVKRMFTTVADNPRVERVTSRYAQFRYLTHKDNPEKYQYDSKEIYSDDINFYEKLVIEGDKSEPDNKAESIINDILRGVSPALMVSRYGRDYVIHMKSYEDCAHAIRLWNLDHPKRIPADIEQMPICLEESPF